MFRGAGHAGPVFTDTLELDLDEVVPAISGPKRPQDRVHACRPKAGFTRAMDTEFRKGGEVGKRSASP